MATIVLLVAYGGRPASFIDSHDEAARGTFFAPIFSAGHQLVAVAVSFRLV